MVLLGVLVFGADTWLHVTTKTVNIILLSPLENQTASYSLSLISPNCTATNNSLEALLPADLQCTMNAASSLLTNGATVLQTLNNQSNAISVLSDGPDPTLAYLTVNPLDRAQQDDFSAMTFGMRTSCYPITSSCNMTTDGTSAAFNCSNGNFVTTTALKLRFDWAFFQDEAITQQVVGGVNNNPFYYVAADLIIPSTTPITNLTDDPEIMSDSSNVGIIVQCSIELFDVQYDVVEGKVINMTATRSNISVANVFEPALDSSGYGTPNLQNAFNMAAAEASSAQDLADMYALSFSKIALSVGAGSVTTTPALAAQRRDSILVSKVLKAPLYLLVVCNLAFVVVGVILAVTAARASPEACEVQARLNIAGVVAYMFDEKTAKAAGRDHSIAGRTEKLYAEYYAGETTKTVGLGRADDGEFQFMTLEPDACVTSTIEVWTPADEQGLT